MSVGAPEPNLGTEERLNEVARLLALGYLRMRERQHGKSSELIEQVTSGLLRPPMDVCRER